MFRFGRSNQEQTSTSSESPEVKELRKNIETAKNVLLVSRDNLLELRRTMPEKSPEIAAAVRHFTNDLDEYARLTHLLNTELAKTPGQKLTDTLEREHQELLAMCSRADEINEEFGSESAEAEAYQIEILRKIDELVALDELEAKMNNRQIDD